MDTLLAPERAMRAAIDPETELFYYCLNHLVTYVGSELKLSLGKKKRPAIDSIDLAERQAATRILDALWEHPELVKAYVTTNPHRLSPEKLNIIAPWQFALRDIFVCLEHSYKTITCVNDERIFEVGSLRTPIENMVGPMPAMAILTLLPYKGRLVCDGRIVHISNTTCMGASAIIDKQLAYASEHPLITTPAELAAYSAKLPANHNVISSFCQVVALRAQNKT